MLRIGVSACFFHPDPQRNIFKGKTLMYLEQSMSRYLGSQGALPILLPAASGFTAAELMNQVDGLLLQGGSDVAPESYGETPVKPEWSGDRIRDEYELELIAAARKVQKPILGICRGHQILNVAFGGSLVQDIQEMVPGSLNHRDWQVYDNNEHKVKFNGKGKIFSIYSGIEEARVNSVHHQCVKKLGDGLLTTAESEDGINEALESVTDEFVVGVQWHPEFVRADQNHFLPAQPLISAFLDQARRRKKQSE